MKIVTSMNELDSLSDNLELKVDRLLQSQETTFVESYKEHMGKVETEFNRLHFQITQLE